MKKIILLLILLLFVSGCTEIQKERILQQSLVIEVIDGDTIKTQNETIRLLDINTPEKGEKCYEEAKERLEELVLGKEVWLERDKEDYDQYNRKLRYIFFYENKNPSSHESHVNLMLLREGLAKLYIVGTNTKYQTIFREEFEKVSSGCLFTKGEYTGCFNMVNFHYDAQGSDCSNNEDEYVTIKNSCQDINMNEWQIKDEARHIYTFDNFISQKDSEITLYTGSGQDTSSKLFWEKSCAIWNNDHDTLYLYDSQRNLVLEYNY